MGLKKRFDSIKFLGRKFIIQIVFIFELKNKFFKKNFNLKMISREYENGNR